MTEKEMYVVTGVTGRTGSVAAKTLLEIGKCVRVVVRKKAQGDIWLKLGAEVSVADYSDVDSLFRAFSGAHGAYIVSPPQYSSDTLFAQAEFMAVSIAQAAQRAKLNKLVALSSIGAEQPKGTGWIGMNRMLEHALHDTGIPVTFLRAAYFMENWQALVKMAVTDKTLASFLAPLDKLFPMVATEDIGRVAAEVLCETWQGVRIVNLEGPDRYSPKEVAQHLSVKLGETIESAAIPESNWMQSIAGQGFSAAAMSGFIEMTQALNSGHIGFHNQENAESRLGQVSLGSVIDLFTE